ncbi:MAG: DoxX family protein [Burkholderiales bacterium]
MTNALESKFAALSDWASLVGRIGIALLFLWSGYGKLVYMAPNVGYMKAYGMPAADLLIWPVLILELAAGVMLVLGWKVRWAALALIVFTVPATCIFHAYWGVPADQALNQQIHFMKNVAIVGGLLAVFAHGSGRYALDRS